ncbi:two pore domain potassium channel family protein [Marinobacter salicampi]|uniref:two pore domain potassium channel family protein n=1 Tax=Marinobacter salicampi TaxID=435907 RepID=UPI00140BDC31|nr:two pore domain potassium channel family protein [Marinobacter salicampi]
MLTESKVVVTVATVLVVAAVIVFHYEVIRLLDLWCRHRQHRLQEEFRTRPTVLTTMFVLLFAHVAEVWLFGATFWLLLSHEDYGAIAGYAQVNLLDSVYFSAANYSTAGWGDLAATGDVRFLAGTEALVGFMMITWSASFSYLIMARTWGSDTEG